MEPGVHRAHPDHMTPHSKCRICCGENQQNNMKLRLRLNNATKVVEIAPSTTLDELRNVAAASFHVEAYVSPPKSKAKITIAVKCQQS